MKNCSCSRIHPGAVARPAGTLPMLVAVLGVVLLTSSATAAAHRQRLGRVPPSCPGATSLPVSQPPPPWPKLVGTRPLWLGVYAGVHSARARITVRQSRRYKRRRRGWPIKILWVVPRAQLEPMTISFARVSSGRRVWIRVTGLYTELSRAPVLDPAHPSHPDDPRRPYTHDWGSEVFFPRAGCYRFNATWAGGAEAFVFGFGRPR
jgi:hypothetical protein